LNNSTLAKRALKRASTKALMLANVHISFAYPAAIDSALSKGVPQESLNCNLVALDAAASVVRL
jgi:hypothetical protein